MGFKDDGRVGQLGPDLRLQVGKGLVPLGGEALQVGFPVVAEDAVQDLEGEVEPPPLLFQPVQEPHPLDAVEKGADAVGLAEAREDALPVVAEGGVADVVAQGDGLQEVLVQAEKLADGAGDLGQELDVQHPVADLLVADEVKNLGFVDVAGVSPGVEDAVGVHREVLAVALGDALFIAPADGLDAPGGIRREPGFLLLIQALP